MNRPRRLRSKRRPADEMPAPVETTGADPLLTGNAELSRNEAARQIRGSSLLLVGRLIALGLTFATQVVLVNALSKTDYGAFAYGLSIVSFGRVAVSLGYEHSLSRFLSIYDEQGSYDKVSGTIAMAVGTITALSGVLFLAIFALQEQLASSLIDDPQAIALLLILVFLAPLEAFDQVFVAIFAVWSRPRLIFFRKYVLTPGLRLIAVLGLVLLGQRATFLAVGYVAAGVVGIVVYASVMVRILKQRGLLAHFRPGALVMPFREVFAFTLPLLATEALYISMNTGSTILLGFYRGTTEVAEYRAVFPAARLNQIVMYSFSTLFLPLAARLYARGDRPGMRETYWGTATWLAVLSFPVFALTGPMAETTTLALFGDRYRDAAALLAILSLGYYFNAALGFNQLTLQTFGRLRYVTLVSIAAAVLNLVLGFLLVPSWGAMGVAVSNCVTLCAKNIANQAGLGRGIGGGLTEWRHVRGYAVIVGAGLILWAVQATTSLSFAVGLGISALLSVVVLLLNRRLMSIDQTFPELARVPLLRRLLS